ncbi:response regulator transcription factor [Amnibacterium kyonggiense]|uniref:DNA-binding response OmpR family regulator n=1 Tax=Amnibacterium kyonggiense TaxID=595671 RepID=A0A4R7FPD1_9MICO|nr:response regulator transcription factor [Amnibacterium kyonggiense]TDS79488.1 DNA-binding response OmpR family regulator [Amnibacterium kyonggiense]
MARVLVIEDDPVTARLVEEGLRDDGHEVQVAATGSAGILAATRDRFDVIATDVMLPDVDGFEICRFLRAQEIQTPILVLTARDAVDDRVRGLDAGADDYLVKPFAFAEFAARIRALDRRHGARAADERRLGPLRLDTARGEFTVDGARLPLSPRETAVLRALLEHPGEPVEREALLQDVWGTRFIAHNIVDQYIGYVRRKLEAATDRVVVESVRGVGYRLVERS